MLPLHLFQKQELKYIYTDDLSFLNSDSLATLQSDLFATSVKLNWICQYYQPPPCYLSNLIVKSQSLSATFELLPSFPSPLQSVPFSYILFVCLFSGLFSLSYVHMLNFYKIQCLGSKIILFLDDLIQSCGFKCHLHANDICAGKTWFFSGVSPLLTYDYHTHISNIRCGYVWDFPHQAIL